MGHSALRKHVSFNRPHYDSYVGEVRRYRGAGKIQRRC